METSPVSSVCVGAGVVFMAALVLLLLWHRRGRGRGRGPGVWPMLGMLPSLLLHVNDIYDWATQMVAECDGTLRFKPPWMANMFSVVTTDPKNIEHILKTKFWNYPKGAYYKSIFDDLLGDGILNTDGPDWERSRKSMSSVLHSPAFKTHNIRTLQHSINTTLVPLLADASRSASPLHLEHLLLRFSFHNMCLLGFGVDLGSPDLGRLEHAVKQALDATVLRFITPSAVWKTMRFLGVGSEGKLKASMKTINAFTGRVITERRKELMSGQSHDMLSMIMISQSQNDDRALRDMTLSFVLAGRDTTSLALCRFFCLLHRHPHVEDKIVSEIRRILGRNTIRSELISLEEVKEMHYLQAALSETLRLYPSLPINWKEARQDDVLPDGTRLKAGSSLIFPIYSMGRMENIWGRDCLEFKPERWMTEKNGGYKYPVFNAGPRTCLGKDFAYLQMKWVAASILHRYRLIFLNEDDAIAHPKLGITLGFNNALPLTVHPRSQ